MTACARRISISVPNHPASPLLLSLTAETVGGGNPELRFSWPSEKLTWKGDNAERVLQQTLNPWITGERGWKLHEEREKERNKEYM